MTNFEQINVFKRNAAGAGGNRILDPLTDYLVLTMQYHIITFITKYNIIKFTIHIKF